MGAQQDAPAGRRVTRPVSVVAAAWLALAAAFPSGAAYAGDDAAVGAEDGADDVPAVVRALDAKDPAARDAARAALRTAPDADDTAVRWLRDAERRARLAPAEIEGLATFAGERRLQLANSGLRALVRDAAQPLAVREAAARALGVTGTLADVGALADGLPDLPDACSRALASIGGDSAIAALRRGMGDAAPPAAIAALAKLGDESRLGELAARLDDPAERERAAELLRWVTGREIGADAAAWRAHLALRDLARRLESRDVDAAQAAVEELAAQVRGGDAAAGERLAAVVADPAFSAFARAKAALALGLSGTSKWNATLLAACANLQPGVVRWSAANALARAGDLSIAAPLAKMLVHDEDRDRLDARRSLRLEFVPVDPMFARALHRVGIRGAATSMMELLAGEYRTGLQRDALDAFREVSGGETFGYQPDASKADRLAAVERMRVWWRDARETLALAPRADDPGRTAFDADVRELVNGLGAFKFLHQLRAKKALAILAEPAAPALVAALASDDLHVRMGAAEVMELTGLRAFAAPLAARLTVEPNPAARTKVLAALETCGRRTSAGPAPGAESVVAAARAALADRDLDVRIAAARVLGTAGAAEDAERVRAAADDPRNGVDAFRAAAAGARLLLGDRGAMNVLCAELRSDDQARQAEAARVLRAAGVDVHGFDPDAPPERREAAVREIEAGVSPGGRK